MATMIPANLLARLSSKLGIGTKGVYARVARLSARNHLPTKLAAIKLAMESGIGVTRFASADDLREIRGIGGSSVSSPMPVPFIPATRPRGGTAARRAGATEVRRQIRKKVPGTTVFVVHGRNQKIRSNMFAFLRAVGLHPLEWSQARKLTGKPNPHVGEILETAFAKAAAIVVLFTPDEIVRQKPEFIGKSDPEHERLESQQSRPNVLFESGMAMGRDPDRTVLVEIGTVRPFSDIAGRHLLRFDGTPESRNDFVDRLESAGCDVKRDGTDWISLGDFSV